MPGRPRSRVRLETASLALHKHNADHPAAGMTRTPVTGSPGCCCHRPRPKRCRWHLANRWCRNNRARPKVAPQVQFRVVAFRFSLHSTGVFRNHYGPLPNDCLANALPISCEVAAESALRFYTKFLRRTHQSHRLHGPGAGASRAANDSQRDTSPNHGGAGEMPLNKLPSAWNEQRKDHRQAGGAQSAVAPVTPTDLGRKDSSRTTHSQVWEWE